MEISGATALVTGGASGIGEATSRLLAEHGVTDLTIEDPPVEDVIEQVFAAGTLR